MKNFFFLVVLGAFFHLSAFAVDFTQIEKDLTGDGLVGWIHGAVEEQGLYVFTYRNPDDFFDYVQMSLVPDNDAVAKALTAFSRNDQVKIKGVFLKNPSPQKHIDVTAITLVKKYDSGYPSDPYGHTAKIPDELLNIHYANFLVHAVASDGNILVVEYKDSILPIFVKNGELTKNLFRGDIVRLNFKVQSYPDQPAHLRLNESEPDALQVIQSLSSINGKPGTIEGSLILFPKSPEIMFNVFAVEEKLSDGLSRQYTIVNFENNDLFTQAREKLQAAWDRHPGDYVNGRNKLVSTKIHVKVSGIFNDVSPSQANPQILFKSLDDIQIIE